MGRYQAFIPSDLLARALRSPKPPETRLERILRRIFG